MQSKKDFGYTYFTFDKNAHKELGGCPVAAYNVNGTYILIPFSKSKTKSQVLTQDEIDQRLSEVVRTIRSELEVKTDPRAHSVDELQMDQEKKQEYICSEKSTESIGRSEPPRYFSVC